MPLGKSGLLWIAERVGNSGLDGLGSSAVGLPFVAKQAPGSTGLGAAEGLRHHVAPCDQVSAFLLIGSADFAEVEVQRVAGVVARNGQFPTVLVEVPLAIQTERHLDFQV